LARGGRACPSPYNLRSSEMSVSHDSKVKELEQQLIQARRELEQLREGGGGTAGTFGELPDGPVVRSLVEQLVSRDREVYRLRSALNAALGGQQLGQTDAKVARGTLLGSSVPVSSEPPSSRSRANSADSCSSGPNNGGMRRRCVETAMRLNSPSSCAGHYPYIGSSSQELTMRDDQGALSVVTSTCASEQHATSPKVSPTSGGWGLSTWDAKADCESPWSAVSGHAQAVASNSVSGGGADAGAGVDLAATGSTAKASIGDDEGNSGGVRRSPRRTTTPRGLEERRGIVLGLQEEIQAEIVRHRESYRRDFDEDAPAVRNSCGGSSTPQSPGPSRQSRGGSEAADNHSQSPNWQQPALPKQQSLPSQRRRQGSNSFFDASVPELDHDAVPVPSGESGSVQLLPLASSSSRPQKLGVGSKGAQRAKDSTVPGETTSVSATGSYCSTRASEALTWQQPSIGANGNSSASCSFFVSANDEDGGNRKDTALMRRRRLEKQALERQQKTVRDRTRRISPPPGRSAAVAAASAAAAAAASVVARATAEPRQPRASRTIGFGGTSTTASGSIGGAGPSPRSSPRPPASIIPASCSSQASLEASNREEIPAVGSATNSTAVSAPEGSASVQSNFSRESVGCRSSGAAGCSDSAAASPPSPAPQNSPAPALRLKFTEMRDEMKRRRSAGVGTAPSATHSAVVGSAVELAAASTLPADMSAPQEQRRVTRSASPTLPRTFDGGMRHMPAVANALRQVQHVVAQQEQVRRHGPDQTQTRARGQLTTTNSIPAEPSAAHVHRRTHSPIPTDLQRGAQRGPSLGHPGGSVAAAARATAGAAFNHQAAATETAAVGDLDAPICGALNSSLGSSLGADSQRVPPISGLAQMRQELPPPAGASEGSWAPPPPMAANRCPDRGLRIEVEVENESSCVETSGGSPSSRRSSVASCCSRPAADPLSSSGKFAPPPWSSGSSASVPGRRSPAVVQASAQQQPQRQRQRQHQQQQAEVTPLGSGAVAAPPALISGQSPHCSPRQADEERSDPLHQAVQQFCRSRAAGSPPLLRQSPGVYTCSGRKLVLLLRNGRLMVRIGNSAVTLTEAVLQAASTGAGISPTSATPAAAVAGTVSAAAAGPSPPPTSTSSLGASTCIAPPPQLQAAKTCSSRPLAGAPFIGGHSTSHSVYGRVASRLASPTVSCSVSPVSPAVGLPLGRGLSFGQ